MRRRALAALAALLVTSACGDLLDPAAAVVHGRKIPMEEVQAMLDAYVRSPAFEQLAAQGDADALKREFEQGRLSDLIMRAVLTPAAEERGIEVTDEDVQSQIDELVDAQFDGSVPRFEEALKEQGLTPAEFEEVLADRMLSDQLRAEVVAGAAPTEADLRSYYEDHQAEFTSNRASHILVDDEALAASLARRLQSAPDARVDALFENLARRHSTDESVEQNGGDLGFQPAGTFVASFEEALAKLEVGEISDPVETRFGWHVIRLVDRRLPSFEDVRGQIESQLGGAAEDEAWNAFVDGLVADAGIEVNPIYGEFDEELRRVVNPDAGDVPGAEEPQPSPGASSPVVPVP